MGPAPRTGASGTAGRTVRVVIADDAPESRMLLRLWLTRHGSLEVTGEAADGVEAVEFVRSNRPDLVLLDVAMPRMDGLEAATEIRRLAPDVRIVVMSAFSVDRMGMQAIDAGADVYLEKSMGPEPLFDVIGQLFDVAPTPRPSKAAVVSRDVSDPAEARQRLLLDALDEGVIVVDAAGRVETANFAATTLLGIPTSRIIGLSLEVVFDGAVRGDGRSFDAHHLDPVRAALKTGHPQSDVIVGVVRGDGRLGWLSMNVRPLSGADPLSPIGVLASFRDAAETRAHHLPHPPASPAPASLGNDAAGLLEAAVVSSAVGIALLDDEGRVVMANPVADRLLGDVADWDLPIEAVLDGAPFDDVELVVAADATGGDTYLKVSGRPVLDEHDRPVGAVITVQDDTARRLAERSLDVALDELGRSNAELEHFAYVASHDLSQPLRVITGFAQLVQETYAGALDEQGQEWLTRIVGGVDSMRRLIDDLLSYSRVSKQSQPFEPVDLNEIAQDVVDLFADRITDSSGEVTVDELPTVRGDRTQLHQLLQNLVANALTYVEEGKRPAVRLTSERHGDAWQVTVADNGIGIPPADRDRVFAMFQRLVNQGDYEGTGIGLAVCRKIVERHGGRIWIEDHASGGSRVRFTLPAAGWTD